MGTILLSAVITDLRGILQDEDSDNYTWTDAFLISAINAAERNIVTLKTDAYVKNQAVKMAAGYKQDIPSDAIGLIKITRNMGTSGLTAGTPVNHIPSLEAFNIIAGPYLATATASAIMESYAYDEDDSMHFYIYPPQPSSSQGYVEMIYYAVPTAHTATSEAITLNDSYASAIQLFALYRAYLLETDAISKARSDSYYAAYIQELGLRSQSQANTDPKTKD